MLLALGACSLGSEPVARPDPIPAGKAQVVITRASGSVLFRVSGGVLVEVNNERLGELTEGGYSRPVSPGPTTVSVSGSSPPGRYVIGFNAQAGKTYKLEVSARREGYLAPPAAGYQVIENEGAFKILPEE